MEWGRFSLGRPGVLDDDVRFLLEKAAEADVPLLSTMAPGTAREEFGRRLDKANPLPPDDRPGRDVQVGGIRVRLYGDNRGAVLLFFHGGGFVVGDLETHDAICRLIAHRTGTMVVSVDYRLAPEHPYPAAFQDAVTVLTWAVTEFPGARIGLCGDSAGGTLAAVTAMAARDVGVAVAIQILIYPAVDQGGSYASRERFGDGYLLSSDEIAWFRRLYFGGDEPVLDWPASPLRGRHDGVAPALIVTAGHDPLADEGAAYAKALEAAGVPVRHVCLEGSVHGCLNMARWLASGRAALDEICQAWEWASSPR